jgi:organic hydroperoxide reductase OsmC/OhrA
MSEPTEYEAKVVWEGGDGSDIRQHVIELGEQKLNGSSAPGSGGDPAYSNPEAMLVGALSSCHMLWFVAYARAKHQPVASYVDEAVGVMEGGKFTSATLRPKVEFEGEHPGEEFVADLHHRSHERCYIANSVNFPVAVEAR